MSHDLVLFDFDGTLADSLPWFGRTMQRLAADFRFSRLTTEEMDRLRDRSVSDVLRAFGIPFWKMPRIAAEMRRLMSEEIGQIALFPGIDPFLHGLSAASRKMGVVSSNSESNVRAVLGPTRSALFAHFECGVALLGKAAKLRRVARAAAIPVGRTIYIGDELRDLEAARKAGIPFGAVCWGCAPPAAFAPARPHAVFRSVQEMQDYLVGRG